MKIGRNDPCPCGSRKKYKYCCLDADNAYRKTGHKETSEANGIPPIHQMMGFSSAIEYTDAMNRYTEYCENHLPPGEPAPTFREFTFGTSAAGGVIHGLGLERVLHSASSLDDARERFDNSVKEYNAGIDREEHRSLEWKLQELFEKGPMRAVNVVTLNKKVPAHAVKQAPIIKYMEAFLEFMVRNNSQLSLDKNGELIADINELFSIIKEQEDYTYMTIDSTGQPHFPIQLIFIKICLIELGFIETTEKGFIITDKGLDFLAGKGRKQVYFRVLRIMTDKVNWFYHSNLPEEAEVLHEARGIALFAAACMRMEDPFRIKPKELLDTVELIVPVYGELKAAGIDRKQAVNIFTDHFLLLYCYFFNFLHVEETDAKGRPLSFEQTDLLLDLFKWEI